MENASFLGLLQSDLVFLTFSCYCQVDSRIDSSWDSREKTVAFSFDYCYWSVDPEDPKYASQEMVSDASCPPSHFVLHNHIFRSLLRVEYMTSPFLFCPYLFLILLLIPQYSVLLDLVLKYNVITTLLINKELRNLQINTAESKAIQIFHYKHTYFGIIIRFYCCFVFRMIQISFLSVGSATVPEILACIIVLFFPEIII